MQERSGKLITELFEKQAALTPDNIALVFEDKRITYRELNEQANRLAHALDIPQDSLVALCLDKSELMLVAILAVLKAGGAYVPIEPAYPDERIGVILEDAAPVMVLANKKDAARLAGLTQAKIIDIEYASFQQNPSVNPKKTSSLAYVIYTSGTTGKPKGVVQTHQNVRRLFAATEEKFHFDARDVWILFHSYAFDFSVWEMWGALLYGGRLVIPGTRDLKELYRLCREEQVTVLNQTPTAFYAFIDMAEEKLPSLRVVIFGGEKLNVSALKPWVEKYGFLRPALVNMYGITETTVHATYKQITDLESHSIGTMLPHLKGYILNEELYIGGEGLSPGYWNNPELTAMKFITDKERGRLYKTGDLVRLLPNGELEYLGRSDFQVKIRGYRIELGEVESALLTYPGIRQCAVVAKAQYLAGYYVSAERLDEEKILRHLLEKLPEYMVPAHLVPLEKLPLTGNGKLDEKQLPAYQNDASNPSNELERQIQQVWQEVFGLEKIGVHDNFFRLGGNSLLAIKLTTRLRKELKAHIPFSTLLKYNTIAGLAAHFQRIPRESIEAGDAKVLSFGQERLWFIQEFEEECSAYNLPMMFKIPKSTDQGLLEKCLKSIVWRHEVLRSYIREDSEGFGYQAAGDPSLFEIEKIKGSPFETEWQNHVFDLSAEFPVRAFFCETGEEAYLCLVIHHIAFDGWSMDLFFQELEALYLGKSLPELKIQYRDFAFWQRSHIDFDPQLSFWKEKLKDYENLNLPADKARPARIDYRGRDIPFELDRETTEGLKALARELNVSLYCVLLAGYALMLRVYSGQEDIVIGTPLANRHYPEIENLIGFFVNALPVRMKIEGEVAEFIQKIWGEILEMQQHQDLPFEKLVEALKAPKDTSRHPVFQVMFGVQSFGNIDELLEPCPVDHAPAKFDLSTFIDDSGECLKGLFNYAVSLFEEETVKGFIATYREILQQLPQKKIGSPSQTAVDEADFPSEGLHELFERQAEKYPDHPAVVYEAKTVTYRKLNERANQLAHYLKEAHGIGPDTLVALCLDRSEQMIVALLAVLKAGGAYVPIDPLYPDERIAYIGQDTGAAVVLANEKHKERLEKLLPSPVIALEHLHLNQPTANLNHPFSQDQLAYVIYTSGTTGKPKGVMIEHAGVVNFIAYYIAKYEFAPKDAISQYLALSFDAAGSEIYSALLSGAALHIIPDSIRLDVKALAHFIESNRITFSVFPPAILGELPVFEEPKRIIVMGESCPLKVLEAWVEGGHQLINGYGPTEATIGSIETAFIQKGRIKNNVIGRPIANRTVYIMGEEGVKPVGAVGELYLGGVGLARGYWNNPAATAEKFVPNPFQENSKLYKTGDLARWLPNGELEFVGRNDFQVKIRGFRIELGEIENALLSFPGIKQSAAIARETSQGKAIVAYYAAEEKLDEAKIVSHLQKKLPAFMLPASLVFLNKLPLTLNGKLDTKALPLPENKKIADASGLEQKIALAWAEVLGKECGVEDNFFDAGGNSILMIRLKAKIEKHLGIECKISTLFKYPTIRSFSQSLGDLPLAEDVSAGANVPVAVIGISGEFPQAGNLSEYWDHLVNGRECLDVLSEERCREMGISEEMIRNKNFFPVEGIMPAIDRFDSAFWQLSERDAALMDPQIRKFLEHAWMALEYAGEIKERRKNKIGVFAGAGESQYPKSADWESQMMSKDFLATRVSYLLGLTGPSLNINTACSTSLTAVVEACKNLVLGTCGVAIAGGVSIAMPEHYGYVYKEGMIFSKDGHCRVFDEASSGTVGGSGIGVVVLKRLDEAIRDKNPILALVKGFASNNDGHRKAGYTAPSALGQTECILQAQKGAGISPDAIDYVECHGTGTPLGDPIEVQALHDAFKTHPYACKLGSVKANIGHVDSAAGAAGFLKVCLMLKHKIFPPQIHFQKPNAALELEKTNFTINRAKEAWNSSKARRAGVSSFGIGGTNAHVILEEYPEAEPSRETGPFALPVSAKTPRAHKEYCQTLAKFLRDHPGISLSDVAYTLRHGRESFPVRCTILCKDREEAIAQLEQAPLNETGDVFENEGKLIELPPYPFEKKRCWYAPETTETIFYAAWKTLAKIRPRNLSKQETWLIFRDAAGVLDPLIESLEGQQVIVVNYDPGLEKIELQDSITMNLYREDHYESLAAFLRHKEISYVIHGWTLTGPLDFEFLQHLGFYSLYFLQMKWLSAINQLPHLICLTNGAHQVTGEDEIHTGKGTLAGALRTISNESCIKTALFDIGRNKATLAAVLTLMDLSDRRQVNYAERAGYLWQEKAEPLVFTEETPLLADGDLILISGGLGGIGLAIAKEISRRHKVKFLLISRGEPKSAYQKESLRIISQNGSEAEIYSCDIGKKEELQRVIGNRKISAVIHAAGTVALGVSERNRESIKGAFQGKVKGAENLYHLLKNKPLKIFALISSLAGIMGDIGRIEYCAANTYLDTLSGVISPFRMLSIDWPGWFQVGMSADSPRDENSLTEEEGAELFYRLMNQPHYTQVIVSKVDPGQIRQSMERQISKAAAMKEGTDLEQKLAEMYSQVLGCSALSKEDSYFELGGDSLSAIRLIHLIKNELQVPMNMDILYRESSIAQLARHIEKAQAAASPRGPLSFAQERLWFVEKYEEGSRAYNIPMIFRLPEEIDRETLKTALKKLVERHEILRTLIREDSEGRGYQLVERAGLEIPTVKGRAFDEEINHIFDLSREYPIRVCFYEEGYVSIVIHHIAFDGWSIDLFLKELEALYRFKQPKLPELKIQYRDFALRQRENLAKLGNQMAYWKEKLNGYEVLNLMTDKARPPQVDYQGRTIDFEIDEETSRNLRKLAKDLKCSLYSVLLAGYCLLLRAYSRQEDLVIGTPVANRHYEGVENLIGFFVNNLALRIVIDPEASSHEFIRKVGADVIEAQLYQDLPFEKLVEELGGVKDTSRHPVFQVVFGVQQFGKWDFLEPCKVEDRSARFDLSAFIEDGEPVLKGTFNYAVSLFEEETIRRYIVTYKEILKQLPTNRKLHYLTEPEVRQIEAWNRVRDYSQAKTVPELFEEKAALFPDRIALAFEEKRVTYRELNERANCLANHLIDVYDVRPDTLIALCFERSDELPAAILGVLKAGGAYVPIDPRYPDERIKYILEDSAPLLVLAEEVLRERLEELTTAPVVSRIPEAAAANPRPPITPANLAYVIYTSGTTGKPKGVLQTHHNITRLFAATQEKFAFSEHDVWMLFHSYAFDFSVWEIFGALLYGGKLAILTHQQTRDAHEIFRICRDEAVTVLNQTPAAFYALIDAAVKEEKLPALRVVIFGGERLNVASLKPWTDYYGLRPALVNMYGITETTVHATYHLVREESGSIGKMLPDLTAHVLDNALTPLPVGAIGELFIGGAGLARGYLNKPQLTEERFISTPFGRLYKSGDLVRRHSDGSLEYVGRSDFQVKIRGYRIELGEIEAALAEWPGVKRAVARVVKNPAGHDCLIGYYVADKPLDIVLWNTLPEYMVPAALVHLEALPLTAHGKIDLRALPGPVLDKQEGYVPPRNQLEEQMCEIFAEVLGLSKVGIQDDFFRLGGDSIVSIQLVSRLRQRLKLKVAVKDIFVHKTIEKLALHCQGHSAVIAEQGLLRGEVPLLPVQEWFFENNFPRPNHWNQAFLIKTPPLNIERLKSSLAQLIGQHDAFRLKFKNGVQYYDAEAPVEELKMFDIREGRLSEILTGWQSGFDLERGPLYSIGYLHGYADGSCRIHFALHHLIIDAVSWRILRDDLKDLYEGKPLGPKTSSYRQWAKAVKAPLEEWKGEEPLEVQNPVSASFRLTRADTEKLLTECHAAYHTRIDDLLLTALGYALTAATGRTVNSIVLEGHGREEIDDSLDLTRTMGWFTTFYPVRLEVAQDLAASIKNIKEALRNKTARYRNLPKICFNYLGQFDRGDGFWSLVDEPRGLMISPENKDDFNLNINGLVIDGELHFYLEGLDVAKAFQQKMEEIILHTSLKGIETEGVYPAGSLQQGFIYHALSQGDKDDAYIVQLLWRYDHAPDLGKLKAAWTLAQKKYGSLRLRFAWEEELVQIIDKKGRLDWRVIENESVEQIQIKDRLEPYKLDRGPLFRVYLIKEKENQYSCLFSHHHAILDGWSCSILINYVHEAYEKETPFAKDTAYEEALNFPRKSDDFWKNYVALLDERIDLGGLLRYPVKLSEYKHIAEQKEAVLVLNERLYRRLKELGQKEGVTFNAILQYAWHKTLKVYGHNRQTVVGTTVSGRNIPVDSIDRAVGLLINTLPLIVNHAEDQGIMETIRHIQEDLHELNNRSGANLAFLQKGERLFDNLFIYENYPSGNALTIKAVEKTDYPLTVIAHEKTFILRYAGELFPEERIQELLGVFEMLLEQIGLKHHPKDLVYQRQMEEWNQTDSPFPDKTITELFEAAVCPDKIALVCENIRLTYKELNERANRLAHFIKSRIAPDTPVALCLDRNEHLIIAILGVLKAGGAYVPVDPAYPDERLAYMLEVPLVLTNESHEKRLKQLSKADVLPIDQKGLLSSQSIENPKTETTSRHLAYILYTSGTTGRPKGVMIEHRSFVAALDAIQKLYFKGPVSTFSLTSCTFDIFGLEYGLPLLSGGTLTLGRNDFSSLDCRDFDFIQMTPSLCELKWHELTNTSNTLLMIGGEKLTPELYARIKSLRIAHVYGPTECTIWSTASSNQTLGRPLPNEKAYVLDEHLIPLPVGAKGELYLGGEGVARGYWNRPDLTAEKFIPNPFQSGSRLYKTGDLARRLPTGELEYIGRNDFQVKIKGHRIELGEVEAALSAYPGIKQAVAAAKGQTIVGYYVPKRELEEREILEFLSRKLPHYMLPDRLIPLKEFPLTLAGKVDRTFLPEPAGQSGYMPPRNEAEKRLQTLFQEVLGIENVGIRDNFFQLGGNSISAIKLVSKCPSLKVADLFVYKTIEGLAERMPDNLVKLNQATGLPNLFMIHPAAAGCEVYASLAKELEEQFSCYGVDSYNLHHTQKIENLTELSNRYLMAIDEVMAKTSQTSYHLLGWSLGGTIALEIASLLEQRNPKTAVKLYILDTVLYESHIYPNNLKSWELGKEVPSNFCADRQGTSEDENLKVKPTKPKTNSSSCLGITYDLEKQKREYRLFAKSEGHEEAFIEKVIANMDVEYKLSRQPLSAALQNSDILLFKAMQKDTRFDEDYALKLKYNNLEKAGKKLKLVEVKAHHGNIIKQEKLIASHIR